PRPAKLRFDPRHSECLVNPFLRLAGHARVILNAEEAVLVQLVSVLDRAIAEDDVVGLGAGEVLHRRAATFWRHEREVSLIPAPKSNARLRVAVRKHAFNVGVLDE